ncbi:MAG: hypothetical protein JXC32_18380 [Anaerolineae bacterium]|nr:hypothetical protein [Anaerolineae bacterium]
MNPLEDEHHRSCLFTVRLWPEYRSDGRMEWRGQVQCVTDRDGCYFREWTVLVSFLELKLQQIPW